MPSVGTASHPLRVAIIGAGPAGFYAAGHLLGQSDLTVEVDLFDKLPTPHGLVRAGVAPDHQKIKNVTRVFDRIAALPGFRFFGNVCLGEHVTVDDLKRHYHQILYATGAQTDRTLGIPGEDLYGSHSATEFVAWYNGHPEFKDRTFDLAQERVAVIGVGNVAIDVARILCRTPEELERTDIADYALDALRASRVREVFILGRRGPAQAKFTNAEIKELGELEGADVCVPPDEAELDPLSAAELENAPRSVVTNVEIVQAYARRPLSGKPKRLTIRFLVSPVEVLDDGTGH
ncbi:MAG: NADP oxidoreductase, partial [Bacteroidetes bacterium]